MEVKKNVIFDVDTGSDDTIAMLLAILAPEKFNVLGICTVNGNRGVACGLNNLQKISDGTPLGGKSRAEDDFATEEDEDFLD